MQIQREKKILIHFQTHQIMFVIAVIYVLLEMNFSASFRGK